MLEHPPTRLCGVGARLFVDRAAEGPGAGAGITWLSLTQSSPPSRLLSCGEIYSHSSNRFGGNSLEI